MAKQVGPIFLERTIDGVIFYKVGVRYYVRMEPCLPDIRRSPRFSGTMRSAKRMGRAAKIGSVLYKALPHGLKRFERYRALTGRAFHLLKWGQTAEEALEQLRAWQQDLVERSCAVAAVVYEGLGVSFRREWMLWAFAEEAMAMLEGGKTEEAVRAELWKMYAAEFEKGYNEEFIHERPPVEEKAMIRKRPMGMRSMRVVWGDSRYWPVGKVRGRRYKGGRVSSDGASCQRAGPGNGYYQTIVSINARNNDKEGCKRRYRCIAHV